MLNLEREPERNVRVKEIWNEIGGKRERETDSQPDKKTQRENKRGREREREKEKRQTDV